MGWRAIVWRKTRDNPSMTTPYESAAGVAYEIDADRFGNYTVKQGGRVVKRVTSVTDYVGKPRWGSRKLEMNAIEDAKRAIEGFKTGESRPASLHGHDGTKGS